MICNGNCGGGVDYESGRCVICDKRCVLPRGKSHYSNVFGKTINRVIDVYREEEAYKQKKVVAVNKLVLKYEKLLEKEIDDLLNIN